MQDCIQDHLQQPHALHCQSIVRAVASICTLLLLTLVCLHTGVQGYAAYGSYMVNDFVFAPSDYLAYLAGPLPHLQASLIQQTAQLRARADLSRAMAAAKDRNTETAADKPFIVSLDLLGMAVFNEAFRGSKVTSDKAGICAVHEDATAMTTLL